MTKICIGIPVREAPERLEATLSALASNTSMPVQLVAIGDGLDIGVTTIGHSHPHLEVVQWLETRGNPACFNELVTKFDADVYVLLESGARAGRSWLEHLLHALEDKPSHGLAGPSTNLAWNEQRCFPNAGGSAEEIDRTAELARQRFNGSLSYLEPLHSLGDFCYAVRRAVVECIGVADDGYGLGPCWEMDYNIRAARAGWRGVWARSAFVWRAPLTAQRQAEQARLIAAAKRRYQDHFCALRLRGERHGYEPHCKGDACSHFAPPGVTQLFRALPGGRASTPVTAETKPAADTRPAGLILHRPSQPFVSCIMPTYNRRPYVPAAIDAFLAQDYDSRELVIIDDGSETIADLVPCDPRVRYLRQTRRVSIGAKRNHACTLARGEIIVHWDDDDWHAPWRLTYQIGELLRLNVDLCGLDRVWFYDPIRNRAWQYCSTGGHNRWIAGGSFCFRRSLWERQRFADVTLGEDTRFVREATFARVVTLERDDFYVARVHTGNTSCKHTSGPNWHPCPSERIREILGSKLAGSTGAQGEIDCSHGTDETVVVRAAGRPLVSCIMPTFNRRSFVRLSLQRFLDQDYPNKELIVVDDGLDRVGDLLGDVAGAHYVRPASKHSIGSKRNLACSEASGEIIVQWDDDDWYAPDRITRQVEPIVAGRADITGIENRWLMSLPVGEFWSVSPVLNKRMFFGEVHGGTLAFTKSIWSDGVLYPDRNLAEDAEFIRQALRRGKRLEAIGNDGLFVYARHQSNAWQFPVGHYLDARYWTRTSPPGRMGCDVISSYQAAAREQTSSGVGKRTRMEP